MKITEKDSGREGGGRPLPILYSIVFPLGGAAIALTAGHVRLDHSLFGAVVFVTGFLFGLFELVMEQMEEAG